MDYKTPNVYVEEVSKFPPSVAGVATAIPAFFGYTERAEKDGVDLTFVPTRISGLLEFETLFGGPEITTIAISLKENPATGEELINAEATALKRSLHPSLRMFFSNGGGECYIVSVGSYQKEPEKADFIKGLNTLKKEDEPTLILFPDAVNLLADDYYEIQQKSLAQCAKMKDRFAVIDIQEKDESQDILNFRNKIGMNDLKYGAAYYPNVITTLNYDYDDNSVAVSTIPAVTIEGGEVKRDWSWEGAGIKVNYSGSAISPKVEFVARGKTTTTFEFDEAQDGETLSIKFPGKEVNQTAGELIDDWGKETSDAYSIELVDGAAKINEEKTVALAPADGSAPPRKTYTDQKLALIKAEDTELYNKIKSEIGKLRINLPSSPAVAGCYAKVDQDRGVWKAPANISLAAVIGPTLKITNDDQERLNVDPTSGKSVNAIRSFTGKGTLVWGARTLAGNDNEWRYIPVRRLFNYLEESIQKATAFAVFEPNNAMTWLKERTMIESFLDDLWRKGAMVGTTAEQAYFVHVGLGTTMTEQDILEGRMIIEIGIAAVRPAEFIILRFSHKVQEA